MYPVAVSLRLECVVSRQGFVKSVFTIPFTELAQTVVFVVVCVFVFECNVSTKDNGRKRILIEWHNFKMYCIFVLLVTVGPEIHFFSFLFEIGLERKERKPTLTIHI